MKKRKYLGIIVLLFALQGYLFATGPSRMAIRIDPVSINKNGDVLCKSFYHFNQSGAYMQMPITYIWLIIEAKGKITAVPRYYLDTKDKNKEWEDLKNELDLWEKIYSEKIDFSTLPDELNEIIKKYGFTENNVEKYKVMDILTLSQFTERYGFSSPNITQYTLDNHQSTSYFKKIFVKYSFPGFIITNNTYTEMTEITGSFFDYYFTVYGIEHELYYDRSDIDGIIWKNHKK